MNDPKPAEKSANESSFDPDAEAAHWSDIAVEDDFGFDVRSSKEVSQCCYFNQQLSGYYCRTN